MREASDEDLMARVATADAAAFRTLCDRHAARAAGFARRFLGDAQDAEDIAQEALLRVWRAAPRWRPTAAFGTWLYRIVVNLCLNHRRKARFLPLDGTEEAADPAPDALARMERREDDLGLWAAVADLPERQRAAILLTYWEGLSNARVADILGTSVPGVETLLVRARRSLRGRLDPHQNGG
ncbi:sigma-70 family RNA polymerase sigma factor [Xanthobacter versatilis]|uniref:sigma-70 family RNA polymerase sigma factor n=1 Tax=Xanthobacter autotrophicus (strain ATCC BAA-1158 / Py2) TaxID=78245 RepID=UPI00372A6F90